MKSSFPLQGYWTEAEYLDLTTNRLIEYSDGYLEVLPMPTTLHQMIVAFFYESLVAFVRPQKLGRVLFAALRVRLWKGKYREPDVVFKQSAEFSNRFWQGKENVIAALAKRQVSARGSITKALALIPVIRPAFRIYPQVLAKLGKNHLIVA